MSPSRAGLLLATMIAWLLVPAGAEAQGPRVANWTGSVVHHPLLPDRSASAAPLSLLDSRSRRARSAAAAPIPRTRALEEAVIGTVVFGVLAFVVMREYGCRLSDAYDRCRSQTLLPALYTTAAGGVVGALIGGAIRAGPADSASSHR
jgi:hypothetical protein